MNRLLNWSFIVVVSYMLTACAGAGRSDVNDYPPRIDTSLTANDGVEIAVSTSGSGPLTLVFVPGWCLDQTYWEEQIYIFSQDYKTVTLDLPGFGKSGKDRSLYSIESYADDIAVVIAKLRLNNVVLIGHSMAGDIILEAAQHNPYILALVGVDNFKDINTELNDEMKSEIDRFMTMIQEQYTEIAPSYAESQLFHSQTDTIVKNKVLNDIRTADPHISTSVLQAVFDYSPKEKDRLSNLKQNLYLINSKLPKTNTKSLAASGVNFKVWEIVGTGHYPMTENPRAFNAHLQEILNEISPAIAEK